MPGGHLYSQLNLASAFTACFAAEAPPSCSASFLAASKESSGNVEAITGSTGRRLRRFIPIDTNTVLTWAEVTDTPSSLSFAITSLGRAFRQLGGLLCLAGTVRRGCVR